MNDELRILVDLRDRVLQKNRIDFGSRLDAIERGDDTATPSEIVAGTGPVQDLAASIRSISIRASPMSRSRCLGSLSKQRWSTSRNRGGVFSGRAVSSGSVCRMSAMVSEIVSPPKARRPDSVS